ncbi:RNA 3'-terminal phosphate cyclase-like, partial [Ostrinia furnacalis]|uniref:RNA 3'-terminal phosphate cyclase-like n=1 Tax=Ostrinia furnacalis TaxID=93504 RepID=UPI00103B30FC
MTDFIDIDGSILEGGGQILRISIALSAILGVPVRVSKIRAGRSKPGLASQHLKGIELVGEMCQARVRGASIGSTEIEFTPGPLRGGQYEADTHTAGSVSLLLQAALPCALFGAAPVELQLRGGTNAAMAPQVDFMAQTFRKLLNRFGADFEMTIHKRGYFPKGGGHVSVRVSPVRYLSGVNIMQGGRVIAVQGASFVAGNLPLHLAHGMADGAKEELRPVCTKIDIKCYKEDRSVAPDNCNGIKYFPKGGGHVSVRVSPVRYLSGVNIMQGGRVIAVQGASFVAGNLPLH